MPILNLNDVNIYYEQHGKGADLVLIAGYSADNTVWCHVLDKLSQYFRVTVYDNRGAGKSSTPTGSFSLPEMAKDVKQLLDELDIPKAHILGHSMGSKIALEFAASYPRLVNKLILVCGTYKPIGFPFTYVGNISDKLVAHKVPSRLILENLFAWVYGGDFLCNDKKKLQELTRVEQQSSKFNERARICQFEAANVDLSQKLKEVPAQTLVIAGAEDLLIPPGDSRFMAENLANSQFTMFENCAHMPQIEKPKEFIETIKCFLNSKYEVI